MDICACACKGVQSVKKEDSIKQKTYLIVKDKIYSLSLLFAMEKKHELDYINDIAYLRRKYNVFAEVIAYQALKK